METENHPEYKLIREEVTPTACEKHKVQKLVDCYNDPNWEAEPVDINKIQFTCRTCNTKRVYMLKPEKTLLKA